MQPEEVGYIPIMGRLILSWTFCVWICFCLLLFLHSMLVVPGEYAGEPDEERGESEPGE